MRVQNANTNGRIGWCLDPIDLFLAKTYAWRDKDREFNLALLDARLLDPKEILERLPSMPVDDQKQQELRERINGLVSKSGL